MYNIKIYNNNIWVIADKVESEADEKMFSMVIEGKDFTTHKRYWSSCVYRTYLSNPLYDLMYDKVTIKVYEQDVLIVTHEVSFEGKNIVFSIPSPNLGDTFIALSAIKKFKEVNGCNDVYIYTEQLENEVLEKITDDFIFIEIGESTEINLSENVYLSSLGEDLSSIIDYHFNVDFLFNDNLIRSLPHSNKWLKALGITTEQSAKLTIKEIPSIEESIPKPYICFSEFASMVIKHWHYENGWQDVVNHFVDRGYTMVAISSEKTNLSNVYDLTGNSYSILHRFGTIKDCEFYIGLDSGISWAANLLDKHCYIIHGATSEEFAFQDNATRIGLSSENYCRGCYDDNSIFWGATLFHTCFFRKDFECTRLLTSEVVINMIESIME